MSETEEETNSDHMSVSDQEGEAIKDEEIFTNQATNENRFELTPVQDSSLSSTPPSNDGGEKNQVHVSCNDRSSQTVIEESRHPTVELDDTAVRFKLANITM